MGDNVSTTAIIGITNQSDINYNFDPITTTPKQGYTSGNGTSRVAGNVAQKNSGATFTSGPDVTEADVKKVIEDIKSAAGTAATNGLKWLYQKAKSTLLGEGLVSEKENNRVRLEYLENRGSLTYQEKVELLELLIRTLPAEVSGNHDHH